MQHIGLFLGACREREQDAHLIVHQRVDCSVGRKYRAVPIMMPSCKETGRVFDFYGHVGQCALPWIPVLWAVKCLWEGFNSSNKPNIRWRTKLGPFFLNTEFVLLLLLYEGTLELGVIYFDDKGVWFRWGILVLGKHYAGTISEERLYLVVGSWTEAARVAKSKVVACFTAKSMVEPTQ